MPMPWGQALDHPVRPLELLGFPLAFTQNDLLSPDDFVKRAGERGVQIRPEHLLEPHRRRALVPLLRIVQRPPRSPAVIPLAASAAIGYHQYRSPLALVIEAAKYGHLTEEHGTLHAVSVQELYDTGLFKLPWTTALADRPGAPEDVAAAAAHIHDDTHYRDWYSIDLDDTPGLATSCCASA
jgi:SMODS-associating 4TM effector domain